MKLAQTDGWTSGIADLWRLLMVSDRLKASSGSSEHTLFICSQVTTRDREMPCRFGKTDTFAKSSAGQLGVTVATQLFSWINVTSYFDGNTT